MFKHWRKNKHLLGSHLTSVFASVGTGTSCDLDRAPPTHYIAIISLIHQDVFNFLLNLCGKWLRPPKGMLASLEAHSETNQPETRSEAHASCRAEGSQSASSCRHNANSKTLQPNDVFNTMQLRVGSREIDGRQRTLNQMVKILWLPHVLIAARNEFNPNLVASWISTITRNFQSPTQLLSHNGRRVAFPPHSLKLKSGDLHRPTDDQTASSSSRVTTASSDTCPERTIVPMVHRLHCAGHTRCPTSEVCPSSLPPSRFLGLRDPRTGGVLDPSQPTTHEAK